LAATDAALECVAQASSSTLAVALRRAGRLETKQAARLV
jgi:hypothetical protein